MRSFLAFALLRLGSGSPDGSPHVPRFLAFASLRLGSGSPDGSPLGSAPFGRRPLRCTPSVAWSRCPSRLACRLADLAGSLRSPVAGPSLRSGPALGGPYGPPRGGNHRSKVPPSLTPFLPSPLRKALPKRNLLAYHDFRLQPTGAPRQITRGRGGVDPGPSQASTGIARSSPPCCSPVDRRGRPRSTLTSVRANLR